MDFMVGLSKTLRKYVSIQIIADELTKSAHFILVHVDYNMSKLAKIYIKEIIELYRVPVSILWD